MRIVAGRHKGRAIQAPPGRSTRPTADRVRQALFDILAHSPLVDLDGARVVDAFAGSGALGFEALSRGAAFVTFLESDSRAAAAIADNIQFLGEAGGCRLLRIDATRPPAAEQPCTLAFLDPPYHSGQAGRCLTALAEGGWLAKDALAVVELAVDEELPALAGFSQEDERKRGAARLVFLTYHP